MSNCDKKEYIIYYIESNYVLYNILQLPYNNDHIYYQNFSHIMTALELIYIL